MNVLDQARVAWAVSSYDWWLDLRGARRRRRRELRHELRTNLRDAAERVGTRRAVQALGSTRRMAAEALPADPTRPRWSAGLSAGLAAASITVLVQLLTALAWLDGVLAADPGRVVTGSVTLLPGTGLRYEPAASGFSVVLSPGWTAVVAGLLVWLVVARPWRVARARARHQDDRHVASVG